MSPDIRHLSSFQRDILFLISDLDGSYGLGIKSELEDYYDEEINSGRVYQNLNTLADNGYLEVSSIDERTNSYTLTEKAEEAIVHRHQWMEACVDPPVAD